MAPIKKLKNIMYRLFAGPASILEQTKQLLLEQGFLCALTG
jgi:hypothetical protein